MKLVRILAFAIAIASSTSSSEELQATVKQMAKLKPARASLN